MEIIKAADGTQFNSVRGWYSYIDTNGQLYRVDYMGDDKGFNILPPQPQPVALSVREVKTMMGQKWHINNFTLNDKTISETIKS